MSFRSEEGSSEGFLGAGGIVRGRAAPGGRRGCGVSSRASKSHSG